MNSNVSLSSKILFIATLCVFFGRAFQLIVWDAPFRELFWDSSLALPLVEKVFGMSWHDYVTNLKISNSIAMFIKINGFVLATAGIAAIFFYISKNRFAKIVVYVGNAVIILLILLEFKEKFTHIPQLFEGLIQAGVPIAFLWSLQNSIPKKKLIVFLNLIIGLTFLGHGLYAINLYATPGIFIDMFIVLLKVDEPTAKIWLYVVGCLDLLVLPFLFVSRLRKPILIYAIIWGVITALARVAFTISLAGIGSAAFFTLYETIYRLSHGLVPLALFVLINRKQFKILPKPQLL